MTVGRTGAHDSWAIGVDVGGTGIKAAVVDLATGQVISERLRVDTPKPALPDAVREGVVTVVKGLGVEAPTGVALPAVIQQGVAWSAANLDKSWIGANVNELLDDVLPGNPVYLNDADAAGLAEARYGAGRGQSGLVVMVTLGTGIGTALVHDGRLVPNAELGHIEIDGADAELSRSAKAREAEGLGWEEWAERVSRYLRVLENLISPDLYVVGGGVSRNPDPWFPYLNAARTPIRLAQLSSNAGIVGAATRTEMARL